jgi:choline-sulfatase
VSLVDLLPTLLDYATGGAPPALASPVDGRSLAPALTGDASSDEATVVSEYLAEGTAAPMLMLKKGSFKYTCCPGDAARLFDLAADPRECENLSGDARYAAVEAGFRTSAQAHWDSDAVRGAVIASQRRRRFTHAALQAGHRQAWDFQPFQDASRQYNRNIAGEMYDTDRRARIPYREPPEPDGPGER